MDLAEPITAIDIFADDFLLTERVWLTAEFVSWNRLTISVYPEDDESRRLDVTIVVPRSLVRDVQAGLSGPVLLESQLDEGVVAEIRAMRATELQRLEELDTLEAPPVLSFSRPDSDVALVDMLSPTISLRRVYRAPDRVSGASLWKRSGGQSIIDATLVTHAGRPLIDLIWQPMETFYCPDRYCPDYVGFTAYYYILEREDQVIRVVDAGADGEIDLILREPPRGSW